MNHFNTKVIGKPLFNIQDISEAVHDIALLRLETIDEADQYSNFVTTPKQDESYYGTVILNTDDFIVLAIGKNKSFAVIHRKKDLNILNKNLNFRSDNNKLNNVNIQIHYNKNKAKVYPWAKKSQATIAA
jgi:hypothetical protein